MDEGVDDARAEDGHEEEEHSDLLADAFLQLVQVPEKIERNCILAGTHFRALQTV